MHQQKIAELLVSPWAAGISLLFGALGVVLSVFFYWKSLRKKRLDWDANVSVLVEDRLANIDGLSISYRGSPLRFLSVARIVIWNAGNETVVSGDLDTGDPLRIVVEDGGLLLNLSRVSTTTSASECSVEERDSDVALLRFSYLDPGHGVVLEVAFGGERRGQLKVVGSARGAGEVRRGSLESTLNVAYIENAYPEVRMLPLPVRFWANTAIYVIMALLLAGLLVSGAWVDVDARVYGGAAVGLVLLGLAYSTYFQSYRRLVRFQAFFLSDIAEKIQSSGRAS